MRTKTLYIFIVTILSLITLIGIMFPGKQINEPKGLPELGGATLELTHIWINYDNDTGLYQYGAQLNITNTRQSTIILTSLQVVFSGEGRNRPWSGVLPSRDVNLTSGETKILNVLSPDVQASNLGMLGVTKPDEYLDLALRQTNLGIRVFLEGTDSSSEATPFEAEVKGLLAGNATSEDFTYTRDITHLGLDSQWLERWIGDFNYLPTQDLFKIQPLQRGVLGTSQFPMINFIDNVLTSYHLVSLTIVKARTITVPAADGPRVYYLFSRAYNFDDYLKDDSLGRDGDSVYFYGDVFNYLAQTGTRYLVMFPTGVSSTAIRDPVEVAKSVIVSRVGEDYFRRYFSDPSAGYDEWAGNETHTVTFTYRISVRNYTISQPIYLYFDANWRLTSGAGLIPAEGNLQPFNVSEEQAKMIAVKAGIPSEPYGLDAFIGNGGVVPGKPSEYQGKYVWYVSAWIDPPNSNPRRNLSAIIDPVTGRLYGVEQGGIASIG